jgi:hypothetical protein
MDIGMKTQTLQQLRRLHHYIGVFLAPAILLFAVSGAFQTFRLQEEKGYGGTPPDWIVWIASVHTDQALPKVETASHSHDKDDDQAQPSVVEKPKMAADREGGKQPVTLPLKIFVVIVALGLFISTLMGVVIALNNRAMKTKTIGLLVAGTLIPVAMLYL